ncbi:hypothetical protein DCS_03502 [Drechmeria coniospora]|uniref:Uncharacterized protein n=1 Tax=Drechmeria coniospora TaxID=98403 RepID=A0A151GHI9_DRECN|nr:hypothetical protein DCS_03502 [Drechmeria coniospora]KYK56502.1 hypothetical protein DCS_03502 [Drechmeria coniospora]
MHNRLTADILTRYRTLVMLATVQAEAGDHNNATPESMAVTGISIKLEFDGLVRRSLSYAAEAGAVTLTRLVQYSSVKELLALSRRIKELWVFGPLGSDDSDRRAKEVQMERDVAHVAALVNDIDDAAMKKLAERLGGTWQRLAKGEPDAAVASEPVTAA